MHFIKKIYKFVLIGLSCLIFISMFLPYFNQYFGDITHRNYFFSERADSMFLTRTVAHPAVMFAFIFAPFLLLSEFKNRDLIAAGLMLFSCLYLIIVCLSLDYHWRFIEGGIYKNKKLYGYYFMLVVSIIQFFAAIGYAVLCSISTRRQAKNLAL